MFRRTLLYSGPPGTSRWYDVAPETATGSRAMLYLRRREGVGSLAFHKALKKQVVPALVASGVLTELRTQVFLPWSEKLWDTPNVAHDNPAAEHLHASVILGFADDAARDSYFEHCAAAVSSVLAPTVEAVHAYGVTAALTFVKNSVILPHDEA